MCTLEKGGREGGQGKGNERRLSTSKSKRGRREGMQKYVEGQEWEPFIAGIPEF